ncbi:MAG: radical SAM family heme chaperone HemW [Pseudomonadota bacterium]
MMFNFTQAIPLSLYVHIPWCVKKCPYCDFNSHELIPDSELQQHYIDALISDLESKLPDIWGRQIGTVFIGGGTPSLFSVEMLDKLLCAIRARLNIHPQIEITIEANPGTAEGDKFTGYREIGINRLSIGVQSFDTEQLIKLGRIHTSDEAINAVALAKSAGFDNLNIDLMFGLPGQTIQSAMDDLQYAIDLTPSHISWYQLTIEPNTIFFSKPPVVPLDDEIWEIQLAGQSLLAQYGFKQYEVSAYAKDNNRCEHNLNYWEFGDYLGIGAGAHGKLTSVSAGQVVRHSQYKLPTRYMKKAGIDVASQKIIKRKDITFEFMLNSMRLLDGIPASLFMERTGLPLSVIDNELSIAEERQWLDWNMQYLKPTELGQRYLNNLLELFLPAD